MPLDLDRYPEQEGIEQQPDDGGPPIVMTHAEADSIFGPVVYAYTRKQALADGLQVDMNHITDASGQPMSYFKFPLFFTRSAYEATIEAGGWYVPDPESKDGGEVLVLPEGQDLPGRFHDVCWMLLCAIRARRDSTARVPFALYVRTSPTKTSLVHLVSECGPLDIDDPQPAITIMLPNED